MKFEIVPTGDYPPHPAYREATEKYAGQTRLAADGALEGYVAGQPFLNDSLDPADPNSGLKAGWNFNYRWQHFGQKVERFTIALVKAEGSHESVPGLPDDHIQDGGTIERVLAQRYQRVYFSHVATLADQQYTLPVTDAEQFEWKDIMEFSEPYEMRGQALLIQRSSDPHLVDQAWTYVPNLRRVRRISTEERADSLVGTDSTLDDLYGFSGRVLDYHWKFHGTKDLLHIANDQHPYARFYGPDGRAPLGKWELRKTLVVENIPKNPNHPYTSKVLFLDAQTYRMVTAMAFDKEGRLWKVWAGVNSWSEDVQDETEMNKGTFVARYLGGMIADLKSAQASVYTTFGMGYPEVSVDEIETLYDVNKLTEGNR